MSLKHWLLSAPAQPRVSPAQLMPLALLAGGFATDDDDDDLDVVPGTVHHLPVVAEARPRPLRAAS
jgi:hypothetical protein